MMFDTRERSRAFYLIRVRELQSVHKDLFGADASQTSNVAFGFSSQTGQVTPTLDNQLHG